VGVWSYQLDGIFIGTTHTQEMRNGMLISFAVFLLAVYLLLPSMGNHGLWAALLAFLATRAITLGLWLPRIERSLESASLRPDRGTNPER
jgi:MATE family multidrug resistance protein